MHGIRCELAIYKNWVTVPLEDTTPTEKTSKRTIPLYRRTRKTALVVPDFFKRVFNFPRNYPFGGFPSFFFQKFCVFPPKYTTDWNCYST